MPVCSNCGASNQAGSTTCVRCGRILEVIPDWLELLLARYGEPMPTFEGISVERASVIAPTEPLNAQRPSSGAAEIPTAAQLEDTDLLSEIEQLKQSLKEQPAEELQPSEKQGVPAESPVMPKRVDNWLSELRALQQKAALDLASETSLGESSVDTTQWSSMQAYPSKEDSPPLETSGESASVKSPDTSVGEVPEIPAEETLGAPVAPADMTQDVPEEPVPEWLRELGLVQTEQSPTPPSSEAVQLSETLGPLPIAEAETGVEPSGGSSEDEIPDWLKRLIAISSQMPESPPPSEVAEPMETLVRGEPETIAAVEPAIEEPLPDWLRELEMMQTARLGTTTPPEEKEVTSPQPVDGELTRAQETTTPIPSEAEERAVPAAEWEVPSPVISEEPPARWLAELEELIERPPAPQPTPPPVEEEVPDWLRELTAEKPEAAPEPRAPAVPETPQLEPAELPGWISRLRPTERTAETPSAELAAAPFEETSPVSGENVIETLRARLGVPQVPDVEGAALFREIVSEPVETTVVPVPEEMEPAPRRNIATVIIWALIFAAILLGIAILSLALLTRVQELLGETAFQRFLNTPAAAGLVTSLEKFRAPIMAVQQDDVVLLSVEYTPATAAEMQPLALVVLRDLLERRARVLTVSLQPEGAPLAQRLLDEMDATYPYGERTLHLGYLPGEAIGVRSLTYLRNRQVYTSPDGACRVLSECSGWRDIQGIEDVKLFVVVSDSAEPVRWWVEQLPVLSFSERPMLATVSAAAMPTVRPYLISVPAARSRLRGLIGGIMAAAAYEVYMGKPGRALSMVAAQSAVHLGLVVVALAGIFAGIRARTGYH